VKAGNTSTGALQPGLRYDSLGLETPGVAPLDCATHHRGDVDALDRTGAVAPTAAKGSPSHHRPRQRHVEHTVAIIIGLACCYS